MNKKKKPTRVTRVRVKGPKGTAKRTTIRKGKKKY